MRAAQRSVRQEPATCSEDGSAAPKAPDRGGGGEGRWGRGGSGKPARGQSAGPQLSSLNAGRSVIIFSPRLLRQCSVFPEPHSEGSGQWGPGLAK